MEAPDEFLCPISLELMSTPVVLQQTSQHYDLASLGAWFESGEPMGLQPLVLSSDMTVLEGSQLNTEVLLDDQPQLLWRALTEFLYAVGGKIDPLSGVELQSPVRLRLDSNLQAHIHAFAAGHDIKLQHLELRYGKVTADLPRQRQGRLLSLTKLKKVATALMHRSEFYPRLQLT